MADQIETAIDGQRVAAGARNRWLTVADDTDPTVVIQRQEGDDSGLILQRASVPVAELLGYPELGDALRVVLIDLASMGAGAHDPPDVQAIADALREPVARIEEIRLAIRRPNEVALEVLIPLVAVFDIQYARRLDAHERLSPPYGRSHSRMALRAGGCGRRARRIAQLHLRRPGRGSARAQHPPSRAERSDSQAGKPLPRNSLIPKR